MEYLFLHEPYLTPHLVKGPVQLEFLRFGSLITPHREKPAGSIRAYPGDLREPRTQIRTSVRLTSVSQSGRTLQRFSPLALGAMPIQVFFGGDLVESDLSRGLLVQFRLHGLPRVLCDPV